VAIHAPQRHSGAGRYVTLARSRHTPRGSAQVHGEETEMKSVLLGAVFALVATLAAADPVEGVWQTEADEGAYAHVTMAPCGAALCGKIIRSFRDGAEVKSANIGKTLVIDMVPVGGGHYEGQVWRPSNNKIYVGKMQVSGDAMTLSGCVAGGLICKSQSWTRVK
jgi:uncharacterized protein (DUF2147 family)